MSPTTALLIGRETVNNCSHQLLTTIVERALSSQTTTTNTGDTHRSELYSLVITRKHELTITRLPNAHLSINNKNLAADEGFESDIDNASLLSSDGDSVNCFVDQKLQTHNSNSDSANSSSASDSSDTETTIKQQQLLQQQQQQPPKPIEHFLLDNLVCYTNIRFPKIIGFVHTERTTSNGERSLTHEFLIFEFSSVENYDRIRYAFNSLSNAAINKNIQANKFNLVQRTDKNGVTHIEISRDTNNLLQHQQHNLNNLTTNHNSQQPSSIISINTPEINTQSDRNLLFDFQISNLSKLRSNSHGDLLNHTQTEITRLSTAPSIVCATTNLIDQIKARSNSNILDDLTVQGRRHEIDGVIRADIDTENIIDTKKIKTLNINLHKNSDESVVLKKVWHSAEDILDDNPKSNNLTTNIDSEQPKKPERRRKQKGRAPPPPNVMKGQYVRVNVDPNKKTEPSQQKPQNTTVVAPQSNLKLASFEMNKLDNYNSNWVYVATSQPSSLVLTTVVTPELNDGPRLTTNTTYESFKNHHQTSSSEFRTDLLDHHRAAATSRYPSISSSASTTTTTTTLNRKNREMLIKNSDRFHNNNNNTASSNKWTNSVPRIPKKIVPPPLRSRSENRYQKNNNPYKYVDTTTTNGIPLIFTNNSTNQSQHQQRNTMHLHASLPTVNNNLTSATHTNTISNRLFGLSQKLKEFGTNVVSNSSSHSNHHHHHHSNRFLNNYDHAITGQSMLINNSTANNNSTATLASKRRSSLGELNYKSNVANLNSRYGTTTQPPTTTGNNNTNNINLTNSQINNSNSSGANSNSNLKSVIKKNSGNDHERNKTKNNNEKKVTFSAFATVQVV